MNEWKYPLPRRPISLPQQLRRDDSVCRISQYSRSTHYHCASSAPLTLGPGEGARAVAKLYAFLETVVAAVVAVASAREEAEEKSPN